MKIHMKCGRLGLTQALLGLALGSNVPNATAGGDITIDVEHGSVRHVHIPPHYFLNRGVPGPYLHPHGSYGSLVDYYDSKNRWGRFTCSHDTGINKVGSAQYMPPDRNDPLWVEYSNEASRIISDCTAWDLESIEGDSDVNDIQRITVFVYDGYEWHDVASEWSGLMVEVAAITPAPSRCLSLLTSDMSFGTVTAGVQGVPPTAQSSLSVECSKDSTITIKVNGGEELTNDDGSIIAFQYTASHNVSRDVPLHVNLEGALKKAPSKPGSYKWYVPILVSYE